MSTRSGRRSPSTLARAAIWLRDVVGEGEVFTKEQLRVAFPDVAQIDRRVRDLRSEGWRIDTNRQDPSLRSDEQRLVRIGAAVWAEGFKRSREPRMGAKDRGLVLAADEFACRVCGVAAGMPYPGEPLTRAELTVRERSGGAVTVCRRCVDVEIEKPDIDLVLHVIAASDHAEAELLRRWILQSSRELRAADSGWLAYTRLSPLEKTRIRSSLRSR